jgi:hypothetical protein
MLRSRARLSVVARSTSITRWPFSSTTLTRGSRSARSAFCAKAVHGMPNATTAAHSSTTHNDTAPWRTHRAHGLALTADSLNPLPN